MEDWITEPARASQIIDFSGLKYKTVSFTDIDALMEYKNRAYIIVEVKYLDKELPFGQQLAIERMVQDAARNGKHAIAIVAEHDVEDTQQSVYLQLCNIRCLYTSVEQKWRKPKYDLNVGKFVSEYLSWLDSR